MIKFLPIFCIVTYLFTFNNQDKIFANILYIYIVMYSYIFSIFE